MCHKNILKHFLFEHFWTFFFNIFWKSLISDKVVSLINKQQQEKVTFWNIYAIFVIITTPHFSRQISRHAIGRDIRDFKIQRRDGDKNVA